MWAILTYKALAVKMKIKQAKVRAVETGTAEMSNHHCCK